MFCIGEQLTFRCTLSVDSYDWVIPGFLDGTVGNGRITIGKTADGNNEAVGQFMLSTSGIVAIVTDTRKSTLQVTVFEGLVGERNISCGVTGSATNTQSVTITVLLGEFN